MQSYRSTKASTCVAWVKVGTLQVSGPQGAGSLRLQGGEIWVLSSRLEEEGSWHDSWSLGQDGLKENRVYPNVRDSNHLRELCCFFSPKKLPWFSARSACRFVANPAQPTQITVQGIGLAAGQHCHSQLSACFFPSLSEVEVKDSCEIQSRFWASGHQKCRNMK